MPRLLVLGFLAASVAAQPAASAQRPPVKLDGVAALRPVAFADECLTADASDAKVVECSQGGTYRGAKVRGTATYTWHWHLFEGGDAPQTASGHEDGIAQLRLGPRGTVRLTLQGIKSSGVSAGRWRFSSGTKLFARRSGSGTFRFATTGGTGGFRTARLVLRGTLR